MRINFLMNKKVLLKRIMILELIIIFILFTHSTYIYASRRKIDIKQEIEKSYIMHWTTLINDKIFDVYVDRDAKIIIIKGEVNTWAEKENVEEYVRLKSPQNYKLICEFIINN